MPDKNLKQIADELMKQPGKIRGEAIISRFKFILSKKGEAGVAQVEKKLKDIGYPLVYKDVRSLGWYSDSNGMLIILTAKDIFNWSDDDVFDMGFYAPRVSFIVKLLMKYFISMEKTFQASPQNWSKHHSTGAIEEIKFVTSKNEMSFKLKDYYSHPLMCVYLRGYFTAFGQLIIHAKSIKTEEVKCAYRGDAYHEYKITWE